TVAVSETKTAANRVDSYFTDVNGRTGQVEADRDVDRLQHWLDTHRLSGIHVQKRGHKLVSDIRKHDIGKYTNKVVRFAEGAAISIGKLLFSAIIILVASTYMLLDFPRLQRAMARRDSAVALRARDASVVRAVGHAALPRDPPGRGTHRGTERDGERVAPAPAARDLRPALRRRDLWPAGRAGRVAAARRGPGDVGVLLRADQPRAVAGRRHAARRGGAGRGDAA